MEIGLIIVGFTCRDNLRSVINDSGDVILRFN